MRTKTAMLESRFLAGDADLAREFRRQFRSKCVNGCEREYVELRIQDQVARHKKFGDSVYLQEPNLKSGCGGLRDYQNLLWMTYFKEGSLSTNQLVGKDWLSESDQRRIENAYDFLLRLRTDLHYATGRATDILHISLQEQIAKRLDYSSGNGQLRSEELMRDYYEHTRNIFRVTERITEQFVSGYVTSKTRSLFSFLPLMRTHKTPVGDFFFVRNKQLHPAGRDLFRRDPEQMMRAFEIAQERGLDLSPELEDLLSRSLGQVTRTYQYARGPRAIFKDILSKKGRVGRILRMMHRVDFLGRYIPEFGQLTCLVQQRSLDDPATVTDFAHIVKHQKNLNALMLLTLADGQGTSAEEWSDWKESLVWALFHETSRCLADQRSYYERTKVQRASLQASVTAKLPSDFAGEIEAHFEFMPDNYFRASDVPEIIEHLKLFRSFLENVSSEGNFPLAPAIQWKAVPEQGHTVVIFCTWDREQLLAKVAGSFSVVPLNILSADIFPRGDNVVLCVFRVCDTKARPVTHQRDVALVEQTLRRALEDESFDFLPLIEKAKRQSHRLTTGIEFPTRIAIDNKTHPVYELIEIQAPDRIGLLYDVLTCLDRENLLVPLSRINTQAGAAIDTLYAVDRSTRAKITDPNRIMAIQQRLQNAILSGGASKSK